MIGKKSEFECKNFVVPCNSRAEVEILVGSSEPL